MKILVLLIITMMCALGDIGKVSVVNGDANIERGGKEIKVTVGLILHAKDIVKTTNNSKVQLIFKDRTIITIGKDSALNIEDYVYDTVKPQNSQTKFNFFKGAFKTITGKIGKLNKKKFKLKTSSASIGIRGTIVIGNQDTVACLQGGISVQSQGTTVDVGANEFTSTPEDGEPTPPQELKEATYEQLEQNIEPEEEPKQEPAQEGEAQEGEEQGEGTEQPSGTGEDGKPEEGAPAPKKGAEFDNEIDKEEEQAGIAPTNNLPPPPPERKEARNDEVDKIDEVFLEIDEAKLNSNEQLTEEQKQTFLHDIEDSMKNIDENNILHFNGKVTGTVEGTHTIIQDDYNQVNLAFDIGSGNTGNMYGDMKFNAGNTTDGDFSFFIVAPGTANVQGNQFTAGAVHIDNAGNGPQDVNPNDLTNFQMQASPTSASTISPVTVEGRGGLKADIEFTATKVNP